MELLLKSQLMNYFDRPEVSNSMLTELKYQITGRDLPDMTEAYAFGNLVDAMITEPDRIDWWRKLLDGKPAKDFDTAKMMYKAFMNNKPCVSIIKNAEMQKVSVKQREFEWNGVDFTLDCRCKWDFYGRISGDIKTTAATNQKQFEAACMYFDYPRSRAWYMDIEEREQDLIIGISKVNYKIFFVPIRKNDELYRIGKDQYNELAFKYWVLIS